jgi:Effector Associated Constant Component 1
VLSEEGVQTTGGIGLAVSDPAQLSALRDWLRGRPEVEVALVAGRPQPGELGSLDVLSVLAGSSGLVAALKTLPDFIRARRSDFRIETTVRGKKFVLDAKNADDVLPILERLLGD